NARPYGWGGLGCQPTRSKHSKQPRGGTAPALGCGLWFVARRPAAVRCHSLPGRGPERAVLEFYDNLPVIFFKRDAPVEGGRLPREAVATFEVVQRRALATHLARFVAD